MKIKIIHVVAVVLLASCTANVPDSLEEIEYQDYVSKIKFKLKDVEQSPIQRAAIFEQAYEASGLKYFILDDQIKDIDDFNIFYDKVIIGEYSGHTAQEQLKVKFINYTITSLNLTNPETPSETSLLVKLTRELMAVNQTVNVGLTYKCLSACKGSLEKGEYNGMIKKAKFQLRFTIEQSNDVMAAQKPFESKEPYQQMARMIELSEQYLADLEGLRIK